eukprot:GHVO01020308.1.p1 GENE.GHVO01020308.1~~GHVO01020308.1.p1  ORF type:complete len:673 (+),score=119.81 GHVO01020308.1:157-2019(+)
MVPYGDTLMIQLATTIVESVEGGGISTLDGWELLEEMCRTGDAYAKEKIIETMLAMLPRLDSKHVDDLSTLGKSMNPHQRTCGVIVIPHIIHCIAKRIGQADAPLAEDMKIVESYTDLFFQLTTDGDYLVRRSACLAYPNFIVSTTAYLQAINATIERTRTWRETCLDMLRLFADDSEECVRMLCPRCAVLLLETTLDTMVNDNEKIWKVKTVVNDDVLPILIQLAEDPKSWRTSVMVLHAVIVTCYVLSRNGGYDTLNDFALCIMPKMAILLSDIEDGGRGPCRSFFLSMLPDLVECLAPLDAPEYSGDIMSTQISFLLDAFVNDPSIDLRRMLCRSFFSLVCRLPPKRADGMFDAYFLKLLNDPDISVRMAWTMAVWPDEGEEERGGEDGLIRDALGPTFPIHQRYVYLCPFTSLLGGREIKRDIYAHRYEDFKDCLLETYKHSYIWRPRQKAISCLPKLIELCFTDDVKRAEEARGIFEHFGAFLDGPVHDVRVTAVTAMCHTAHLGGLGPLQSTIEALLKDLMESTNNRQRLLGLKCNEALFLEYLQDIENNARSIDFLGRRIEQFRQLSKDKTVNVSALEGRGDISTLKAIQLQLSKDTDVDVRGYAIPKRAIIA